MSVVPIVLPDVLPAGEPPPQRVYISGYTYKLGAPRIIRAPLPGSVKVILNWASIFNKFARNILYMQGPSTATTSDPALLNAVATTVRSAIQGSNLLNAIGSQWSLQSVTARDNGLGSGAQETTTTAPLPGLVSSGTLPPGASVAISWNISASYRGGKPRWYLVGIPNSALNNEADSSLSSAYADQVQAAAKGILVALSGVLVDSLAFNLGTISYQTGHSTRPTPLFRLFVGAEVHQRLDTQRRRLGKESAFAEVGP